MCVCVKNQAPGSAAATCSPLSSPHTLSLSKHNTTVSAATGARLKTNMAPPAQAYAVPSSTTMVPNLHLDPAIRDWVVLPLLVIMIAAGLLRTFVGQLLRAKSRKVPLPEARGKNVQQRARRIASGGGGFLGRGKWEARRRYFCGSGRDAAADGGGGLLADEANFAEQYKEAQIGEGGDPLSDMNPMVSSIQAHYFTQRLLLLHNPI